jgi:hypothetical protein
MRPQRRKETKEDAKKKVCQRGQLSRQTAGISRVTMHSLQISLLCVFLRFFVSLRSHFSGSIADPGKAIPLVQILLDPG